MDSDEELLNSAINAYNSKDYTTSLEKYNKLIELYPDSKEAYYNKGIVLQKLSEYPESLEAFNKSLEIDNDFIPSLLGKGLSLSYSDNKENALTVFDKIISLEEKNFDAYLNKENTLFELKRYNGYNEALECINKIENLIINDEIENKEQIINKINFIKGNIEHQKGDLNKAIELYNIILEKDKINEQAMLNKGICLLEQNNLDEAIKQFSILY